MSPPGLKQQEQLWVQRSFSEIIQISEVKLSEATASAPDHLLQLQALQIFTRKSILAVSAPHPSAELSEQLSVISVRVSHCSFLKGIQSCCLDVSALCCVLCQDDPTLNFYSQVKVQRSGTRTGLNTCQKKPRKNFKLSESRRTFAQGHF